MRIRPRADGFATAHLFDGDVLSIAKVDDKLIILAELSEYGSDWDNALYNKIRGYTSDHQATSKALDNSVTLPAYTSESGLSCVAHGYAKVYELMWLDIESHSIVKRVMLSQSALVRFASTLDLSGEQPIVQSAKGKLDDCDIIALSDYLGSTRGEVSGTRQSGKYAFEQATIDSNTSSTIFGIHTGYDTGNTISDWVTTTPLDIDYSKHPLFRNLGITPTKSVTELKIEPPKLQQGTRGVSLSFGGNTYTVGEDGISNDQDKVNLFPSLETLKDISVYPPASQQHEVFNLPIHVIDIPSSWLDFKTETHIENTEMFTGASITSTTAGEHYIKASEAGKDSILLSVDASRTLQRYSTLDSFLKDNPELFPLKTRLIPTFTDVSGQFGETKLVPDFTAARLGRDDAEPARYLFSYEGENSTLNVFLVQSSTYGPLPGPYIKQGEADAPQLGNGSGVASPGVYIKIQVGNEIKNGLPLFSPFGDFWKTRPVYSTNTVMDKLPANRGRTLRTLYLTYDYSSEDAQEYMNKFDLISGVVNRGLDLIPTVAVRTDRVKTPKSSLGDSYISQVVKHIRYVRCAWAKDELNTTLHLPYVQSTLAIPEALEGYAHTYIVKDNATSFKSYLAEPVHPYDASLNIDENVLNFNKDLDYLIARYYEAGSGSPSLANVVRGTTPTNGYNGEPTISDLRDSSDLQYRVYNKMVMCQGDRISLTPKFYISSPLNHIPFDKPVHVGDKRSIASTPESTVFSGYKSIEREVLNYRFSNTVHNYLIQYSNIKGLHSNVLLESGIDIDDVQPSVEYPREYEFISEDNSKEQIVSVSDEGADGILIGTDKSVWNASNLIDLDNLRKTSNTGVTSNVESESSFFLFANGDTIYREGYYREADGRFLNEVNSETRLLDNIDNCVSLFSRHRLFLLSQSGSDTIYCLTWGKNRRPVGISTFKLRFNVKSMHKISENLVFFVTDDGNIMQMDFSNGRDTVYLDGGTHPIEATLTTLPVFVLNDIEFSAYTQTSITAVALTLEGYINYTLRILDEADGEVAALEVGNVTNPEYKAGVEVSYNLGNAREFPRLSITTNSGKYISFASAVLDLGNLTRDAN